MKMSSFFLRSLQRTTQNITMLVHRLGRPELLGWLFDLENTYDFDYSLVTLIPSTRTIPMSNRKGEGRRVSYLHCLRCGARVLTGFMTEYGAEASHDICHLIQDLTWSLVYGNFGKSSCVVEQTVVRRKAALTAGGARELVAAAWRKSGRPAFHSLLTAQVLPGTRNLPFYQGGGLIYRWN